MKRGFWDELGASGPDGPKPIIALAPMDGVTDAAFRYMVCKYSRPSFTMTEFTNVEGLARGAVKMLVAFIYDEIERPVVGQIFGTEVESFYKATVMLCAMGFDGVDINMGCPALKVANKGSGAGLIRTPELAREIIRACKRGAKDWAEGISLEAAGVHEAIIAEIEVMKGKGLLGDTMAFASDNLSENPCPGTCNSQLFDKKSNSIPYAGAPDALRAERKLVPISVKTRVGYDSIVVKDWIKILLEERPANISLHGRTLKQMYMGKASWEAIAEAAEICREWRDSTGEGTTLLGNGDVESMADAREKIATYGVDGVLVGRAAFGDPWFFGGAEPDTAERLRVMAEHARYLENLHIGSFHNMRKHLGWYCKGFDGAKELRKELMQVDNADQVEAIVQKYL